MLADKLNEHLKIGGQVRVSTHTRAVIYTYRNTGDFVTKGGSLYVRRGRGLDRLSHGERLLVAVAMSETVAHIT